MSHPIGIRFRSPYSTTLEGLTHTKNLAIYGTLSTTHSNTQQHTATYSKTQQHTATHSNTQQHTATHSNAQQRTATHSNAQQHTAMHSNTQLHMRKLLAIYGTTISKFD